ncbi:hypothetical protein A2U01_0091748, partial [Trifolium medium]|nr:hypothetical protein [Trifolium medium]
SSDSDFDAEKDALSIKPPAKKTMSAKKIVADMEEFPCDNVSFHLASYAQRWSII